MGSGAKDTYKLLAAAVIGQAIADVVTPSKEQTLAELLETWEWLRHGGAVMFDTLATPLVTSEKIRERALQTVRRHIPNVDAEMEELQAHLLALRLAKEDKLRAQALALWLANARKQAERRKLARMSKASKKPIKRKAKT